MNSTEMEQKLIEIAQWDKKQRWFDNQHKRAMKLCQKIYGIPYMQHRIIYHPQMERMQGEFSDLPDGTAMFQYSMQDIFDKTPYGQYDYTEYDEFADSEYIGNVECCDDWKQVCMCILAHEVAHMMREMHLPALVKRFGALGVEEPVEGHDTYWQKCYAELRAIMLDWFTKKELKWKPVNCVHMWQTKLNGLTEWSSTRIVRKSYIG